MNKQPIFCADGTSIMYLHSYAHTNKRGCGLHIYTYIVRYMPAKWEINWQVVLQVFLVLSLQSGEEKRIVQMQYIDWPDHGEFLNSDT